jgi:hypothetical protein
MTPEMLMVFGVVFAVWGAAVAMKALKSLRSSEPYVFGMWDGGMLRAGKRLSKVGCQIKIAVGALMSAGCIALVTKAVAVQSAAYFVMAVAIVSIISDFATAES